MAAYALTPANVRPSNQAKYLAPAPAGVAITAGQPVYQDANGVYQLTDSDASATAADVQGIAPHNVAAGQPLSPVYEDPDYTHGLTGVVAGTPIFTHPTAGALGPIADVIAGNYTALAMIAISATKAVLKIVRTNVPHA